LCLQKSRQKVQTVRNRLAVKAKISRVCNNKKLGHMDVPFSTPEANMLIYKIVTLDDVLAQVSDQTELCCDTETIGLYGKIRTIQFFQRHWEYVLIVERPEPIDLLLFFSKIKKVRTAYQG